MNRSISIFGLHGESHASPADTLVSYWAALGAGADGFVAGLQKTFDDLMVCCPSDFVLSSGTKVPVDSITAADLRKIDAGAEFYSTVLGSDNQPTGEVSKDRPWAGNEKKKPPLYYPTLDEVLRLFGRRTQLMLLIEASKNSIKDEAIAEMTLKKLDLFGLIQRVILIADKDSCQLIRNKNPAARIALIADPEVGFPENLNNALRLEARYLCVDMENVQQKDLGLKEVKLLLTSREMKFAPTKEAFEAIADRKDVYGLLMPSVDRTASLITPPALVLYDDFSRKAIKRDLWACGYSHANQDTTISQDNGFIVDIKERVPEEGHYSGGAAVTLLPILGNFDARVEFKVSHPAQGTTFEIAAIGIDPGHFIIDNSALDSRTVNLTFDVHGAPPYASSERDQDDGFRIGWNNGYNLTQIDANWNASSANMYNKYGRDVGIGTREKDDPQGMLRLVRNGPVFAAFYKDRCNQEWVCSGAALVSNLGQDVHIRLAAKHWNKEKDILPGNRVVFRNFRLYQF